MEPPRDGGGWHRDVAHVLCGLGLDAAAPIRSEIGHFCHPESLEDAAEDVRDMARRAAEEPSHVHGVDGRFHRIHYRIENHLA